MRIRNTPVTVVTLGRRDKDGQRRTVDDFLFYPLQHVFKNLKDNCVLLFNNMREGERERSFSHAAIQRLPTCLVVFASRQSALGLVPRGGGNCAVRR